MKKLLLCLFLTSISGFIMAADFSVSEQEFRKLFKELGVKAIVEVEIGSNRDYYILLNGNNLVFTSVGKPVDFGDMQIIKSTGRLDWVNK